MPASRPSPEQQRALQRAAQAAVLRACDPCEDTGWEPGPQMNSAAFRIEPSPQQKHNEFSNACDPLYGLAIRYFPANLRAALSEVDPDPPGDAPPIYYRPITQGTVAGATKGWVLIGSVPIPNGFNAVAAKVVAAVEPQEWANAVEFRLMSTGQQVAGLQWRGRIEWPSVRPIMRVGEPGRPVTVEASVPPQYWTTGATPIRSRIMATVLIEVLCHSVSGPCKD